jgi:hypothetical protein
VRIACKFTLCRVGSATTYTGIGVPLQGRCCIDRQGGRDSPGPRLRSGDADGVRAPEFQHAVEAMDSDAHLGCLTLVRVQAEAVTDHLFEARDARLGFGPPSVAGCLLPSRAAVLGNVLEVAVALRRCSLGCLAQHRISARRYDDHRRGMALGAASVPRCSFLQGPTHLGAVFLKQPFAYASRARLRLAPNPLPRPGQKRLAACGNHRGHQPRPHRSLVRRTAHRIHSHIALRCCCPVANKFAIRLPARRARTIMARK